MTYFFLSFFLHCHLYPALTAVITDSLVFAAGAWGGEVRWAGVKVGRVKWGGVKLAWVR